MSKQSFVTGQVLTAAQMTTLQANDYNQTVSTKTTSYVLVATDAGTNVEMNAAGSTTITVNTSLFSAGDTLTLSNKGAGVCTVTAGTATVSTAGVLTMNQYESGRLYFISASAAVWYGSTGSGGDLTAITGGTGISVTSGTGPVPTVAIDTATTVDKTTAQTLTNKTLTTPIISSISNTGTLTLPTSTDTLVGRATTDTLTNKTFDSAGTGNSFSINGNAITSNTGTGAVNVLATLPTFGATGVKFSGSTSGTTTVLSGATAGTSVLTLPVATDTLVGKATTDTLTNKTLTAPLINLAFNAQTGTTYTLVAADSGKLVSLSNAAAITLTLPISTFAAGEQINIIAIGAGQVTLAAASGAVIVSTGATASAPKLRVQYSAATIICQTGGATPTFYVVGDLS